MTALSTALDAIGCFLPNAFKNFVPSEVPLCTDQGTPWVPPYTDTVASVVAVVATGVFAGHLVAVAGRELLNLNYKKIIIPAAGAAVYGALAFYMDGTNQIAFGSAVVTSLIAKATSDYQKSRGSLTNNVTVKA
jgi:hypothetical protein